jgi:hypothetical protein
VTYHLARLRSPHEELYGAKPDVEYPRPMMQQAVEHYRTRVYASILRSPSRRTAGHDSDTPHVDAGPRSCADSARLGSNSVRTLGADAGASRGSSMKDRGPPRRGRRHFVEAMLAARLRTTAFPEGVCGTRAATASFVGHDQQCEGGSPSSPAPSVPAENVHPSLNRHSPLAPSRADGRCHASWERTSARP